METKEIYINRNKNWKKIKINEEHTSIVVVDEEG